MYVKNVIRLDPIMGEKIGKLSKTYCSQLQKTPISPNFDPNKSPLYINSLIAIYYTHL